jgi:ABC-type cobalamin/Fe3+-siderophores transport system ATPase subunit
MQFYVISSPSSIPPQEQGVCYLVPNVNWNDWFKYRTVFELIVVDNSGQRHYAGNVKIGARGMDTTRLQAEQEGYRQTLLPDHFEALDDNYFSVGQSENYYETLTALGVEFRVSILSALRDIAFNRNLIPMYQNLDVYSDSVRRDISESIITRRYRELAGGGATLTPFSFRFTHYEAGGFSEYSMDFAVVPNSVPPTNLHTIIGRNGVGKTHCLRSMAACITNPRGANAGFANLFDTEPFPFRRIVSVSFSAFDPFVPMPEDTQRESRIEHEYIGLKSMIPDTGTGSARHAIDSDAVFKTFIDAAYKCGQGVRRDRWRQSLESLGTDPIFSESGIANIALPENDPAQYRQWFERLSSGHMLILLTVTRLVAATEERTLILLDEPEAHLHPPLLSAFVRCLSQMLINRNAVAVVATHSPVVLQEVPSTCAHIITRTGGSISVHRPEMETFGESVGRLTAEVFGLEVVQSGFHRFIVELASSHTTYDEALQAFGGHLGSVGRALLRVHFLQGNGPWTE